MSPTPSLLCVLALRAASVPAQEPRAAQEEWTFVERTDTGVDFVHRRYQTASKKYLPEITGSGVGLFDFDLDGDLDLYCVQCCPLPGWTGTLGALPDRLYRNEGNFHFTPVPAQWEIEKNGERVVQSLGLGDLQYGMGVTCPDVNGDGYPDLFVTNVGRDVLYQNNGDGTFRDVTDACGIADEFWSAAAAWADLDGDGDLDLYLGNYALIDYEHYNVCGGRNRIGYCHPDTLKAAPDRMFRNDGNFHFEEVTLAAGIVEPEEGGKALAVVPFDWDLDGKLDLFVSNDADENFLWHNLGELRFEEVANDVGVAVNGHGKSQSCMGTDIADVDGDLDLDIFATNFGKEASILYIRGAQGFYDDRTYASGLGEPSYLFTGFGAQFFDYDRDADLDLMVVNGHVDDLVEERDPSQTFLQVPHFYENRGNGTFVSIGPKLSPFFTKRNLGRGLATGDLDNDGDIDVVVCENDGALVLLENRSHPSHHWIGFSLEGTKSPRQPIGARVYVTCDGKQQVAELHGSTSYLSWVDLRLFFGLGNRTALASARILWPSGCSQELGPFELDRYHHVVEPRRER